MDTPSAGIFSTVINLQRLILQLLIIIAFPVYIDLNLIYILVQIEEGDAHEA